MFEAPPSYPQSVGDIVGRGCRLLRQNVPVLLREQIMPCVVMVTGHILIQFAASYGLKDPKDIGMLILGVIAFCVGMVISVLGFWFLTIKQFAFIRMANGLSATFDEANKFAIRKKWTVIGLFFLFYFFGIGILVFWGAELVMSAIFGVKLVPLGVSGVLLGTFGLLISFGLLSVYFLLMNAALASEDENWAALFARVIRLVSNDIFRACGFAVLLSTIVSILSYTLSLPVVALAMFELIRSGFPANHADPMTAMPFYCLVLSQFWQAIINMFLLPISFMSAGLFYRDLKVRQEGLDVVQNLQQLTASGV